MSLQLETSRGPRVIKAGQYQSDAQAGVLTLRDLAQEAQKLVLDARQEAARIVSQAKLSAEAARQQACEQGMAQGLEQGRAQGYAEGLRQGLGESATRDQAQFDEMTQLAGKIVAELSAARDELLHQARRQMLAFAMELAQKIVGQIASADVSAAQANLEKALKLAQHGGEVLVRVNLGQLDELRSTCRDLLAAMSAGGTHIRLEGDEHIGPGGVRLLSRCGEIDATIETQLHNVAASLLGNNHQPLLFEMFGKEESTSSQ